MSATIRLTQFLHVITNVVFSCRNVSQRIFVKTERKENHYRYDIYKISIFQQIQRQTLFHKDWPGGGIETRFHGAFVPPNQSYSIKLFWLLYNIYLQRWSIFIMPRPEHVHRPQLAPLLLYFSTPLAPPIMARYPDQGDIWRQYLGAWKIQN